MRELEDYAVVLYQPGINFKMLLSIFGVPETKTDVIRAIMSENKIMPVNGDIRQNTGVPISQGTMIKVHKKYLSPSSLKVLRSSQAKSSPIATQEPEKIQASQGTVEKIRSVFLKLMNNKNSRHLVIFSGATLLSVTVATSVMLILDTPTPPPKKKQPTASLEKKTEKEYQIPPFEVIVMQKTYARFKDKPNSVPVDSIPREEIAAEKLSSVTKSAEIATEDTSNQNTGMVSKKSENIQNVGTLAKNETIPESRAVENLPPSGMVDGEFIFSNRTTGEELKAIIAQMNAMGQG